MTKDKKEKDIKQKRTQLIAKTILALSKMKKNFSKTNKKY
jgi:hypothetical protein